MESIESIDNNNDLTILTGNVRENERIEDLTVSYCANLKEISNLIKLRVLTIFNCSTFTKLDKLTNLSELKIFNCSLFSIIPPELTNLENIIILLFYNGHQTGMVNIKSSTKKYTPPPLEDY